MDCGYQSSDRKSEKQSQVFGETGQSVPALWQGPQFHAFFWLVPNLYA
jgi:hypothetical protein